MNHGLRRIKQLVDAMYGGYMRWYARRSWILLLHIKILTGYTAAFIMDGDFW